ncbi:lytic transglycosylase domain-containing protein, partial [Dermatophilus congolensis]
MLGGFARNRKNHENRAADAHHAKTTSDHNLNETSTPATPNTKIIKLTRGHISGVVAGLAAAGIVTTGVLSVGAATTTPPPATPPATSTSPATTPNGHPLTPVEAAQLIQAAMKTASAAAVPPASKVTAAPVNGTIPARMVLAYKRGEYLAAKRAPSCKMPWWLLAGIGRVESGHASNGDVDANGVTRTRILGPRLDGQTPGIARINDTDHGALDGDTLFDRAVGPMQFIPGTWNAGAGTDGNADGTANPSQVDDAAASAALYLCGGGGKMTNSTDLAKAILRYNNSSQYVQDVIAGAMAYRDGRVPVTPPREVHAVPSKTADTTASATPPAPTATASPTSTKPTATSKPSTPTKKPTTPIATPTTPRPPATTWPKPTPTTPTPTTARPTQPAPTSTT